MLLGLSALDNIITSFENLTHLKFFPKESGKKILVNSLKKTKKLKFHITGNCLKL